MLSQQWVEIKLVSFFLILALGCTHSPLKFSQNRSNSVEANHKPYVVLISIDGYRADYTSLYHPPFLSQLEKLGASAKSLLPVYPTKTFTNHMSIATGLYAENHGIVANRFYDPSTKEFYSLSDKKTVTDPKWYHGEPIWVTAEKQKVLTASYFWPGSEAPIQGIHPNYFYAYNKLTSIESQTQQIIDWLKLPEEKRPHLIIAYFHHVDTFGHQFGTTSKEVKNAILKLDKALGLLASKLDALHLPINMIIVSDHGMEDLDSKKVIYLEDYIAVNDLNILGDAPQMLMYIDDKSKIESTYQTLKRQEKHFHVYRREDLPRNYHYSNSSRSGDVIIIAEPPYSLSIRRNSPANPIASHGYPPQDSKMNAIFYADGPQIRTGFKISSFENIHIYPFIAKILGLKIDHKIDGNLDTLKPILKEF